MSSATMYPKSPHPFTTNATSITGIKEPSA